MAALESTDSPTRPTGYLSLSEPRSGTDRKFAEWTSGDSAKNLRSGQVCAPRIAFGGVIIVGQSGIEAAVTRMTLET